MPLFNFETGQKITLKEFKRAHPNRYVSWDMPKEQLAELGVALLRYDNEPDYDPEWQRAVAHDPILDEEGSWRVRYSIVTRPVVEVRAYPLEQLTYLLEEKEDAGIFVEGAVVTTDAKSRVRLLENRPFALEDSTFSMRWGTVESGFLTLDAATIIAWADAVRSHIQACLTTATQHRANLLALNESQAIAAYDIYVDWPDTVPKVKESA
jgi:hypothetical protein